MSETVADEPTQQETPEPAPEPLADSTHFPWPPSAEAGVVNAFVQTVEQSIRSPSEFFRALPARGYGSALSYFLIVGILAAGMRLFWSNVFELVGYQPLGQALGVSSPDAADRLISFLLQPLVLLGVLFGVALVTQAALHIVDAARAPLVSTTRIFAFSYGPQLFVAIPFIGAAVAFVGTLLLFTIGLREVHQTSTRRVLLALMLPFGILLLLALIGLLVFVLVTVGAVVLRLPL